MSWVTRRLDATDVVDARSFASFCQQELGMPFPTGKKIAATQKNLNAFFRDNPRVDWRVLCKTVEWVKNRRRRIAEPWAITSFVAYAWEAGYLPELDACGDVDEQIESDIEWALCVETDPDWRRVLMCAAGSNRKEVFATWKQRRAS